MMEYFFENGWRLLAVHYFCKKMHLHVWQDSENTLVFLQDNLCKEICSKLTWKTPKCHQLTPFWCLYCRFARHFGVFKANFEQISLSFQRCRTWTSSCFLCFLITDQEFTNNSENLLPYSFSLLLSFLLFLF